MSKSDIRPNESWNARMRLRSVKSVFNAAHRNAAVKIAAWSLALGLASCSPATLNAQETVKPPKDKPVAAAVDNNKKPVTYETIASLDELKPYLDNAKDKQIPIDRTKMKQVVETKDFMCEIWRGPSGVSIFLKHKRTGQEEATGFNSTGMDEFTALAIPSVGANHPIIDGETLVFGNSEFVLMYFFDKKHEKLSGAIIDLKEGNMRRGPVQTGYGVNEGSLFVFNAPKDILPGDVVVQGDIAKDGSTGASFYIYAPDKPAGTLVASPETK